jgi:hypothetical protein
MKLLIVKILAYVLLVFFVIGFAIDYFTSHSREKELCDKISAGMTVEQLRSLASVDLKDFYPNKYLIGSVLTYGCEIAMDKGVVQSAKYRKMD